jgi:hypothetical protein
MGSGPKVMNKKLSDLLSIWNIYSSHVTAREKKK